MTDRVSTTAGRLNTENAERMITERGMLETYAGAIDEESETKEMAVQHAMLEARMRLNLENEVELNPYYKTLFYGLKKNHPHNAAVLHPIAFLTRRVLYAAIVVFMVNKPFFASVILLLSCFMMICFVASEA